MGVTSRMNYGLLQLRRAFFKGSEVFDALLGKALLQIPCVRHSDLIGTLSRFLWPAAVVVIMTQQDIHQALFSSLAPEHTHMYSTHAQVFQQPNR